MEQANQTTSKSKKIKLSAVSNLYGTSIILPKPFYKNKDMIAYWAIITIFIYVAIIYKTMQTSPIYTKR